MQKLMKQQSWPAEFMISTFSIAVKQWKFLKNNDIRELQKEKEGMKQKGRITEMKSKLTKVEKAIAEIDEKRNQAEKTWMDLQDKARNHLLYTSFLSYSEPNNS